MDIPEFYQLLASKDKDKKPVSIAKIREIVYNINVLTGGVLYKLIKQDLIVDDDVITKKAKLINSKLRINIKDIYN